MRQILKKNGFGKSRFDSFYSVKPTVKLIAPWDALGFFIGSTKVFFPFSVDMSNFLTSFSVKSNTTIAIYLDQKALLFNQTQFVFERDNLFGTMTTIRYKINFQAQKRMNRKLCRILRRIFGFIIFVHHFMRKEKYPGLGQTLSTGFWSGAGIGEHLHQ